MSSVKQDSVKQEVRQFYDQIGWSLVGDDIYQNARYEDLRPVAREYIHRCHLRVGRYLAPQGRFLLDAGSGPIQYPEYLDYSRDYQYRVCADISITALREARRRIGTQGLFVVADISNLPFKSNVFEGAVSLHTIHHLPEDEHLQAYQGIYRTLAPGCTAVVVNGWPVSPLMDGVEPFVQLAIRAQNLSRRLFGKKSTRKSEAASNNKPASCGPLDKARQASKKGTFTQRHDVQWVRKQVGAAMPLEIFTWRSVSVRFMRALIHPWLAGRYWLRLLFWFEERYPVCFGENGQYPIIKLKKLADNRSQYGLE
jgi:ubiquinone/menaquinone biosynthesis C-methylase UbiE